MSPEFDLPVTVPDDVMPISISSEINQVYTRRVDDGGFADGDAIGIYIVNYKDDQPGTLTPNTNHADNVKYTFDADSYRWNADRTIYWKDKVTPVDAYGYYPYSETATDHTAIKMHLASEQDAKAAATPAIIIIFPKNFIFSKLCL